jgi:hypothetical protein
MARAKKEEPAKAKGGKRPGAGPPMKFGAPTKVIRVPEDLAPWILANIPTIRSLKEGN